MSLQRCRRETTSTEFLVWKVFFEKELNGFHREDYFLANIAKTIAQVNSKDPGKIDLKPFLLKFETEEKAVEDKMLTEEALQERIRNSKNFWAVIAGASIPVE